MMVRGQYFQLLVPELKAIFNHFKMLNLRENEFDMIFNKEDSVSAFEDELEFAGLGPQVEKPETDAIFYDEMIQGGIKRYVHLTYGLGGKASWELVQDDKYGIIKKLPDALIRSAKFTKEYTIWNVINQGFALTTTTDGVTLFNNEHPLLGGIGATNIAPGAANVISTAGTFPNRPNPDMDLSMTALQLMVNQFERLVDAQGMPVAIKPKHVVIPPELQFVGLEILGSPNKPYTSDNEINSLIPQGLQLKISHYLTSNSAWFVFADKAEHTMKYLDRVELFDDYDDDFDTRAVKQVVIQRFSAGATVWYGTWGSNGP